MGPGRKGKRLLSFLFQDSSASLVEVEEMLDGFALWLAQVLERRIFGQSVLEQGRSAIRSHAAAGNVGECEAGIGRETSRQGVDAGGIFEASGIG